MYLSPWKFFRNQILLDYLGRWRNHAKYFFNRFTRVSLARGQNSPFSVQTVDGHYNCCTTVQLWSMRFMICDRRHMRHDKHWDSELSWASQTEQHLEFRNSRFVSRGECGGRLLSPRTWNTAESHFRNTNQALPLDLFRKINHLSDFRCDCSCTGIEFHVNYSRVLALNYRIGSNYPLSRIASVISPRHVGHIWLLSNYALHYTPLLITAIFRNMTQIQKQQKQQGQQCSSSSSSSSSRGSSSSSSSRGSSSSSSSSRDSCMQRGQL